MQHKYVGRGEKPRFKSLAVLPPASSGGVARPPFAASSRWAARHASNIVAYLKNNCTAGNTYALWHVAYCSARTLVFGAPRFLVLNSPFSELFELQDWAQFCEWIGTAALWGFEAALSEFGWAPFDPFCSPGLECLAIKVKEAQDLATKIVESCIEVRKQRFSSWVQEQSAGGGGGPA